MTEESKDYLKEEKHNNKKPISGILLFVICLPVFLIIPIAIFLYTDLDPSEDPFHDVVGMKIDTSNVHFKYDPMRAGLNDGETFIVYFIDDAFIKAWLKNKKAQNNYPVSDFYTQRDYKRITWTQSPHEPSLSCLKSSIDYLKKRKDKYRLPKGFVDMFYEVIKPKPGVWHGGFYRVHDVVDGVTEVSATDYYIIDTINKKLYYMNKKT